MVKSKEKIRNNPWTDFYNWLFDGNKNSILDEKIVKDINQKFILTRFSSNYRLTEVLNEIFNDINIIYTLDNMQFCKFIKDLVIRKRISKYDIVYKGIDKHTSTNKLIEKLPHLKGYEIDNLLKYCKGDPEEQGLLYYLGLIKDKKIKSKKPKKLISNKKSQNDKKTKITMEEWVSNFNYE